MLAEVAETDAGRGGGGGFGEGGGEVERCPVNLLSGRTERWPDVVKLVLLFRFLLLRLYEQTFWRDVYAQQHGGFMCRSIV